MSRSTGTRASTSSRIQQLSNNDSSVLNTNSSSSNNKPSSKSSRRLSLSDLPNEEKDKIARLAQRLVGLGRDYEALKKSNNDISHERDNLQSQLEDILIKLDEEKNELLMTRNLLFLYQSKLMHMVSLHDEALSREETVNCKCKNNEIEISRLNELIISQRKSIDTTKSQANLNTSYNEERIRKLENDNKLNLNQILEKDMKIDSMNDIITQYNNRIQELEKQNTQYSDEIKEHIARNRSEKDSMQELLDKAMKEIDSIRVSTTTQKIANKVKSKNSLNGNVIHFSGINNINTTNDSTEGDEDVPWAVSTIQSDEKPPMKSSHQRAIYPLSKPNKKKTLNPKKASTTHRRVSFLLEEVVDNNGEERASKEELLANIPNNSLAQTNSQESKKTTSNSKTAKSSYRSSSISSASSAKDDNIRSSMEINKMGYDPKLLYLIKEIDKEQKFRAL